MIIWVFHSYNKAELIQRLNNFIRGEVGGVKHSFNNLGPIVSGPLAFCGFKEHSTMSCNTSDSEKEMGLSLSLLLGEGRLRGSGKEDVLGALN